MTDGPDVTLAPFGSLDWEVARDLGLLRAFIKARERHMRNLFGRNLRWSATRDELMRAIVLAFAQRQILRVSDCIRLCGPYATPPTVRAELALMVDAGLVVLAADGQARQASPSVLPSEKLIQFYNREIPRLREDFRDVLAPTDDHGNGSSPRGKPKKNVFP